VTAVKRNHVHTEVIPIRWGDMDAMGHVNNTIYFRYVEQARISWFDAIEARPDPQGAGPRMYAGKPRRSSFETWLEMRPSYDPATVYAEGAAKVVRVDFAKGRSIPLPDRIRHIIAG